MSRLLFRLLVLCAACRCPTAYIEAGDLLPLPDPPTPTKEFEVRGNSAFLGGKPVRLWGLRCVHALRDRALTERLVRNLDSYTEHGINLLSVYLQAAHGGYPDIQAGANPFGEFGLLNPDFAWRLEWLAREADRRGMVLLIGVITPIKDQELRDEEAIRRAIEETARFLETRMIRNVIVDLMYEFDHPTRIAHEGFREPGGSTKKSVAANWFHAVAPGIKAGVTTETHSSSSKEFAGMDLHLIQKEDPIPANGYALNIESLRRDVFGQDGIFTPEQKASLIAEWDRYRAAPNVGYVLNTSYTQSIGGPSGTGPHFEMGGYGTGPHDRGIRFYFEWLQSHVGRYEYPDHIVK
ncbi:hypothetical protein Pan44_16360 [Caulifigura coniformis]|uniref:Glycoside hydrolase family 5 domain-containing protein n=1 Tax=Caulifigura coniformis TaxID=2527983 RepID=A0A517SBW9_9PLAN|nr:hypothetical protein [Caulifigura coniformis]QDT53613.1 hypothetical protein Pan44_16360 [Caulifigura coniformis]